MSNDEKTPKTSKEALRNEALINLAYVIEGTVRYRDECLFEPSDPEVIEKLYDEALKYIRDNSLEDDTSIRCMLSHTRKRLNQAIKDVGYKAKRKR